MPIKTTDFAKMLGLGLGRAVLYAQQHDMTAYREVILNACLRCQSYDQQLEGARGVYMFNVINATNDTSFYRNGILAGLMGLTEDDSYDVSQLYHLAGLFADEQGDLEAKQAMFDKFDKDPELDEYAAIDELILFFAEEAFRAVASRVGAILVEDNLEYIALRAFDELKELIGEEAAKQALDRLPNDSVSQQFKRAVLNQKKEDDRALTEEKATPLNGSSLPYPEIKAGISKQLFKPQYFRHGTNLLVEEFGVNLRAWGKTASADDLRQAAQDLLAETEPIAVNRYLTIFQYAPFPLDPSLLFPFVSREALQIAPRAWTALKQIVHPVVRQFGLRNLNERRSIGRAGDLLIKNYEPGDWALFNEISADLAGIAENDIHGFGMTIKELFKLHPGVEAETALFNMYEQDKCGMCRFTFVENLHRLDKLPDWMRDECRYDSYSHTREFIAGLDRAEQPKL